MNKIYLGNQVIVDLSNYYQKAHVDASIAAVDASALENAQGIDSLDTTVTGLDASIGAIFDKVATDYYTKTAIDASVLALEQEIQAMAGIDLVVVDSLPSASADTLRKIYLVPTASATSQNTKDEYVTIDKGAEDDPRYVWEKIGTTEVDLSGYATKTYVDSSISDLSTFVSNTYETTTAHAASVAIIDASIDRLDASVSALEGEVKIYGDHSIENLVNLSASAYAALDNKNAKTLYIVTDNE